jgi:hypothetical protein
MTPKLKLVLLLTSILMVAAQASASYQECTSTITGNFNGTAINEGDYIWFTGVLTVKGMGSGPTTVWGKPSQDHVYRQRQDLHGQGAEFGDHFFLDDYTRNHGL